MERVGRVTAVRTGVIERSDNVEELLPDRGLHHTDLCK
jgi:hypothetical protein